MNFLIDFVTNPCVMVPLVAWLLAQIIKTIINSCVTKEVHVERLWGDGGMPSSHSAIVSALVVTTGVIEGFDSSIFAVAFILAAIVMHDATGVRRETGKQAVTLKKLADLVNDAIADPDEQIRTEKLKELVGHTPLQVTVGGVFGALIALGYFLIWGFPS